MIDEPVLVIAEAGVNHNGSEELALELIDCAKQSGANIVKFQTFKAKNLVTGTAKQAEYQKKNTQKDESQLEMLSRLELSYESHIKLVDRCEKLDIEFLSTAFDSQSLEFLVNVLGLKRLKIPSGEITNAPLVLEHANTGADLIVSTGMSSLAEIENILGVIAFGYISNGKEEPSIDAFNKAYSSSEGISALKEKVTLLHCTTEYPAPFNEINLNAMDTLRDAFKLNIGYSDHSEGISVPVAAVVKGATLIEKHFTLDKGMPGPDHKASLDPAELKSMVQNIRDITLALGDGIKRATSSEVKNKFVARKSLVASNYIKSGEHFGAHNLDMKRPGDGVSPYLYWEYVGKKSTRDYEPGELIIE